MVPPCNRSNNHILYEDYLEEVVKYYVVNTGYHYLCGLDVALYIFALMMKNIVIVSIHIALEAYNGIAAVPILAAAADEEVLLAEDMIFVIIYSMMIGIHQIIIGILWFFYVCKHSQCNGRYFHVIIYCIDYIFYLFYVLNPMILIYTNYNGLYSAVLTQSVSFLML